MPEKYILAGGSGLIGSALAQRLRDAGHDVVILTRARSRVREDGVREVNWDGRTVGDWARELAGAAGVVNLAGASINCVHTPENRRRILDSRIDSVRVLGEALRGHGANAPAVWVQSSAVGIYGNSPERCDESTPPGAGYLAEICREWEAAFVAACPAGVRGVVLRIGVVLDRRGGAFPELERVARYFLGGAAGSGRQGISWILLEDLLAIFVRALREPTMQGVYNACAPEPVANAAFMRSLRDALDRPWAPPAPAWAVKLAAPTFMETDPSLALEGQYALPARLEAEGFAFQARQLGDALRVLVR